MSGAVCNEENSCNYCLKHPCGCLRGWPIQAWTPGTTVGVLGCPTRQAPMHCMREPWEVLNCPCMFSLESSCFKNWWHPSVLKSNHLWRHMFTRSHRLLCSHIGQVYWVISICQVLGLWLDFSNGGTKILVFLKLLVPSWNQRQQCLLLIGCSISRRHSRWHPGFSAKQLER